MIRRLILERATLQKYLKHAFGCNLGSCIHCHYMMEAHVPEIRAKAKNNSVCEKFEASKPCDCGLDKLFADAAVEYVIADPNKDKA